METKLDNGQHPQRVAKTWHLATTPHETALTEFEFAIIRVASAFDRWQSDCLACCGGERFSGADVATLHVIRMHDRGKKGVTYQVTTQGREVTDLYAQYRQELLLAMTKLVSNDQTFEEVGMLLNHMSGMYDQAARVAATHLPA